MIKENKIIISLLIGFFLAVVAYIGLSRPQNGELAKKVLDEVADEFKAEFDNKSQVRPEEAETMVTGVIDGDTVIVAGGDHVRLLGIDANEKEEECYEEAKNRLEELVLKKTVTLKPDLSDKDQYGRLLRYIILDGENINFKLVEEGLAICRFYDDNPTYKKDCAPLEIKAIRDKIGCVWSD